MRLTTALIITGICSIWGTLGDYPHLWIPYTGFIASCIDLPTRAWVRSDKLGQSASLSVILKFILALIGMYAMIVQFVSIGLVISWYV